ncbi:hypothetical protein ABZP36_003732 [Zizania latifolia]
MPTCLTLETLCLLVQTALPSGEPSTAQLTPSYPHKDHFLKSSSTDYSNGRFRLQVEDGNLKFDLVAVPSGNYYSTYWTTNTVGNGSQLLFNATGRVYFTLKDGTEINITSTIMGSMVDYYQCATLDPDGVFRQYVYPKKEAVRGWNYVGWITVDFIPRNICEAIRSDDGSGACGFNSFCSF